MQRQINDINFNSTQKNQSLNKTITIRRAECSVDPTSVVSLAIIATLMRNVIPLAGMIISSVILVIKLRQVRGERWSARETSFTRSVLALNAIFFVTQFPSIIAWGYLNGLYFKNVDQLSYEFIMAYFVFTLTLFLNSFTFVFPTLINFGFNRIFRDEVLIVLNVKKATQWETKHINKT